MTDAPLILVVEDDSDLCDLVTTVLESDLEVQTAKAEDGEQGLELARKLKPDLVFLDIKLPRLSGLEIAKLLKADPTTQMIPLIAMTSEPRWLTKAAGCDDHVPKPFDIFDLLWKARALLGPHFQIRTTT